MFAEIFLVIVALAGMPEKSAQGYPGDHRPTGHVLLFAESGP